MSAAPSTRRAHIARAAVCAFVMAACNTGTPTDWQPVLVTHTDTASFDFGTVEIRGLPTALVRDLRGRAPAPAEWERVFSLRVADTSVSQPDAPAILGSWSATGDVVRFTPRFPPVPGQSYTIRFDASAPLLGQFALPGSEPIDTSLVFLPVAGGEATRVLAVYPSVDRVPVNLLRLYIEFSAPMSVGEAAARLHLRDDSEAEVQDAFLVVPQELWDPEHRRLTVLFDPGRIKRGIRPNEEIGLPLQTGRRYTLVIDSAWNDAGGRRLASGFTKAFDVGPADRSMPRPGDWNVATPRSGTRAPLRIAFHEPLDYALLRRLLHVEREDGTRLEGDIRTGVGEADWTFTPDRAWTSGRYRVLVATVLEDIAGNSLRRVFDTDPDDAAGGMTTPFAIIPFEIDG